MLAPRPPNSPHTVDTLIAERAPRLTRSPLWPMLRPALYAILKYREARDLADAIAPMNGEDALAHTSGLLRLRVETRRLERIPQAGRCIIAGNHPTGIADGVAMYDALHAARPDLAFFANADAHRVCPGFSSTLIPVVWPAAKRTLQSSKRTLREAIKAFDQERPIVIYPSGAVGRFVGGHVQDRPWESSVVTLAKKHRAPVIPAHTEGPFAFLFHALERVSAEFRDITLFHELLNKAGRRYRITFGPSIAAEALRSDGRRFEALFIGGVVEHHGRTRRGLQREERDRRRRRRRQQHAHAFAGRCHDGDAPTQCKHRAHERVIGERLSVGVLQNRRRPAMRAPRLQQRLQQGSRRVRDAQRRRFQRFRHGPGP
jgi:putative hemolysin